MKEMNPMMAAVCKVLEKNNGADFQTVKAKVAKHGDLYPIVYGRAKALLGLVPTKPRKDRVEATGLPKRGPGRPRKSPLDAVAEHSTRRHKTEIVNGYPADGGDGLPKKLEELVKERNRLSKIIEEIEAALS
jgi:hypothetical protein